jgi:hypothetical protein
MPKRFCPTFAIQVAPLATHIRVGTQDFPLAGRPASKEVSDSWAKRMWAACYEQDSPAIAVSFAHLPQQ